MTLMVAVAFIANPGLHPGPFLILIHREKFIRNILKVTWGLGRAKLSSMASQPRHTGVTSLKLDPFSSPTLGLCHHHDACDKPGVCEMGGGAGGTCRAAIRQLTHSTCCPGLPGQP